MKPTSKQTLRLAAVFAAFYLGGVSPAPATYSGLNPTWGRDFHGATPDLEQEAMIELRSTARMTSDFLIIAAEPAQALLHDHSGMVEPAVIAGVTLAGFMEAGTRAPDSFAAHGQSEGTFSPLEPAHRELIPVPEPDLSRQLVVGVAGLMAFLLGKRTEPTNGSGEYSNGLPPT